MLSPPWCGLVGSVTGVGAEGADLIAGLVAGLVADLIAGLIAGLLWYSAGSDAGCAVWLIA